MAWPQALFIGLIVLTPLPLGSNRPLWWTLIAAVLALLFVIHGIRLAMGADKPDLGFRAIAWIAVPYGLMLAWAFAQGLPILPSSFHHPLWPLAAEALDRPIAGTIALDPHEAFSGAMRLLSYGGVFWLAFQHGRSRLFADRFLRIMVWAAMAYAVYGLAMHLLGIERILWLPKWAYPGSLTSTFVNRNSYATYAALGLICAVALGLEAVRDTLQRRLSLRHKLTELVEVVTRRGALPLVATLIIATALVETGSRAGALSALVGLMVLAASAGAARLLSWRHVGLALGGVLFGAIIVLALSGGEVLDRLETLNIDKDARGAIYDLTMRAIGDNPIFGTGLGSFPAVFALYRGADFDTYGPIGQAHNSYLENALELGLPAAMLMFAAVAAMAATMASGLIRRRRGRLYPVLGLSALVVVAVHATVDFSLEIPAVAVSFAAIAGVACAQSIPTMRRSKQSHPASSAPH